MGSQEGIRLSGKIFRVTFFCFFLLPYMPNDQEKAFKHLGELFSCAEKVAEMRLDHRICRICKDVGGCLISYNLHLACVMCKEVKEVM